MREEDLIKKLEGMSMPKIEIQGHKEKLRLLLMERHSLERKRGEFFSILNKLIPAGAIAAILLFFIFNNMSSTRYSLAKEIALQNTDIKNWIEQGATIKDVKVIDGKAYVLIEPAETTKNLETETKEAAQTPSTINLKSGGNFQEKTEVKEDFKGALAEINIKEKKIKNIEKLTPTITGLIKDKKERVLEIANKSSEIQEVVPKEAEVLDINVLTPKLKLAKKGNSILVLPEPEIEEKASIIYKSDGKRWEGKINLNKEEVEEVRSLEDIENNATQENLDR